MDLMGKVANKIELSVVLPCRNEEKAIGLCIEQIKSVFKKNKIAGEIVVSDSSIDRSPEIARSLGARVIKHDKKGYGIAYIEGFKAARGKYIFCADADGTYDFNDIPKFLHYLKEGYDFAIGNRFGGKMAKEAMPWSHRYIGNPVLSGMLRLFFRARVRDSHCGVRAISREALDKLELKTTGMEFASEMVMKSIFNKLKIKQIDVAYNKRIGESKLSSFSDGWRHLRFMLMYAPDYLFMIPGIALLFFGALVILRLLLGPVSLFGITFYNSPIVFGSFFVILGYQIIALGIYSKAYMKSTGFIKSDRLVSTLARFVNFETGLVFGALILVLSLFIGMLVVSDWVGRGFPAMSSNVMIAVLTLAILGIQTIFSAFFLSMVLVEKNGRS